MMNPRCAPRIAFLSLTFGAFVALAGCGKSPAPPDATATSTPPSSAASNASSPLAGIVPQAEESAGSGVPGPGSGTTAVGGMAGQQDRGGATNSAGKTPAPTGGDGAASASASAPS